MNRDGRPRRDGQIARQTGAMATAVTTARGLVWQVSRERDGLTRTTTCLAHSSHWTER
jgi:hypothetical protein